MWAWVKHAAGSEAKQDYLRRLGVAGFKLSKSNFATFQFCRPSGD
jgi:hypothetical protein